MVNDEAQITVTADYGEDMSDDEAGRYCAEFIVNFERLLGGNVIRPGNNGKTAMSGIVYTGEKKEEYHWIGYGFPGGKDYVFEDGEKEIELDLQAVPKPDGQNSSIGVRAELRITNITGEEKEQNAETFKDEICRALSDEPATNTEIIT